MIYQKILTGLNSNYLDLRRVVKVFIVKLIEHRQYNCIVMSIHFMAKENKALQSYLWLS